MRPQARPPRLPGLFLVSMINNCPLSVCRMPYYRRRNRKYTSYPPSAAAQHVADRRALSLAFAGIDNDVEEIFLNLPPLHLEAVLLRYGKLHGAKPEAYARVTYPLWKRGSRKMSGLVAERLLNLVPMSLDASVRFDLVKKLRKANLKKSSHYISTTPGSWREAVIPLVRQLVESSASFTLTPEVTSRVQWLANGDTEAAQQLLAAAEQEEAAIRISYLDSEFQRIDAMISAVASTPSITHRIELPQGNITVSIAPPKRSFWRSLLGLD